MPTINDAGIKTYSAEELKEIIRLHAAWVVGGDGGSRADLSRANLSRANLSGADLSRANLSRADLSRANLSGANLSGADLSWADLSRANLSGADLSWANLSRANLSGANLSGADLSWADLSRANLSWANLSWADLSWADLSRANLSGANLSGADLSWADLSVIKADMIVAILKLPNEIPFLRRAIIDGKVNGSSYTGECACLAGTMAKACQLDFETFRHSGLMPVASTSPRERWFLAIQPGDTPDKSAVAKITLEWIDESLGMIERIRQSAPSGQPD